MQVKVGTGKGQLNKFRIIYIYMIKTEHNAL